MTDKYKHKDLYTAWSAAPSPPLAVRKDRIITGDLDQGLY